MLQAAKIQTIIEILDDYCPTKGKFNLFIKKLIKNKRYIGSKDRKYITDLAFQIFKQSPTLLRQMGQIDYLWQQQYGRLLCAIYLRNNHYNLDEIFSGTQYAPKKLSHQEKHIVNNLNNTTDTCDLPLWLYTKLLHNCNQEDLQLLNDIDTFDLRVNTNKITLNDAQNHLADHNIPTTTTKYSFSSLRVANQCNITNDLLYLMRKVDIQNEGSQIIAKICCAKQNIKILDLCAGAGGKSCAMLEYSKDRNVIYSTDIDPKRLQIAQTRVKHQSTKNIKFIAYKDVLSASYQHYFDIVLIDAPCSGTGTMHRNPEIKFTLDNKKLHELENIQLKLLTNASNLVKKNGSIVYATCSMLAEENQQPIKQFLAEHRNYQLEDLPVMTKKLFKSPLPSKAKYIQLRPSIHQTDGFFIASLKHHNDKTNTN